MWCSHLIAHENVCIYDPSLTVKVKKYFVKQDGLYSISVALVLIIGNVLFIFPLFGEK